MKKIFLFLFLFFPVVCQAEPAGQVIDWGNIGEGLAGVFAFLLVIVGRWYQSTKQSEGLKSRVLDMAIQAVEDYSNNKDRPLNDLKRILQEKIDKNQSASPAEILEIQSLVSAVEAQSIKSIIKGSVQTRPVEDQFLNKRVQEITGTGGGILPTSSG